MKVLSEISVVSTLQDYQKFCRADPYSAHPRKVRSIEKIEKIARENGYDVLPLKELLEIPPSSGRGGLSVIPNGEVKIVKPANLTNLFFVDLTNCGGTTLEAYNSSEKGRLQNLDILVLSAAHAEGYIGTNTSIVHLDNDEKAICIGELIRLRPNIDKINPYYLTLYLNSIIGKHMLNYSARGQTVHLYPKDIEYLPILLPPREIQDSIGNKLKQAIEAKIEAEEKRNEIEKIFKKYFDIEMKPPKAISSIYTSQNAKEVKRMDPKYFSPQLVIYENFLHKSKLNLVNLGKLVKKKIRRGVQPQYDEKGEIPVIKTGNVYNRPIEWEKTSKVSLEFYKSNKDAQVPKNSLVVTSTGEGSWGRTSISTVERALADGHIAIVEINEEIINPYYVCAFLWTPYGKAQYERRVRGSTGQTEIYPMDIETIIIPRLDDNDENLIAEEVRTYFIDFYRSIELHSQAMEELNKLLGLSSGGDKLWRS